MVSYSKLGTLSIRFMAVAFFVLAIIFLFLGFAGPMAMGSTTMGSYQQAMPGGFGQMMQGGIGFWWGPMLGNVVIGLILYALSRPIGNAMGSGLDE